MPLLPCHRGPGKGAVGLFHALKDTANQRARFSKEWPVRVSLWIPVFLASDLGGRGRDGKPPGPQGPFQMSAFFLGSENFQRGMRMEGEENMGWKPADPFKMCLLILSTDEKRREKAVRTPKEHFQALLISRKMKHVTASKKYASH